MCDTCVGSTRPSIFVFSTRSQKSLWRDQIGAFGMHRMFDTWSHLLGKLLINGLKAQDYRANVYSATYLRHLRIVNELYRALGGAGRLSGKR